MTNDWTFFSCPANRTQPGKYFSEHAQSKLDQWPLQSNQNAQLVTKANNSDQTGKKINECHDSLCRVILTLYLLRIIVNGNWIIVGARKRDFSENRPFLSVLNKVLPEKRMSTRTFTPSAFCFPKSSKFNTSTRV